MCTNLVAFMLFFQKLPSEIVHLVFTHLRKPELARAALVCRKWAAVAADPRLWEALRFPLNLTNRYCQVIVRLGFFLSSMFVASWTP